MTCKELMTAGPAYCVPEDNVVRGAMLMKQHEVGSVPVVADSASMKLTGIVTDRDLALRVIAEQRDYYKTRISDVMSGDLVTCLVDDDAQKVLDAMGKRQLRRIPVVDHNDRLVGIISQADVARHSKPSRVAETVEAISQPEGAAVDGFTKVGLLVAGGLGLGAGLFYLLNPRNSVSDY